MIILSESFIPAVTSHIDGTYGINRGKGRCMLNADNDIKAIESFLEDFQESPCTWRAYKKEITRFWLWSVKALNKPISSLLAEDMAEYKRFLQQIPDEWICAKRYSTNKNNEYWRPFTGQLSETSVQHALVIVHGLFAFLVDSGYLGANPMFRMSFKRRTRYTNQQKVSKRMLSNEQWSMLVEYLEEQTTFEGYRTRFLIAMLVFLGLRISELENAKMNNFQFERSRWVYKVTKGKGNIDRMIGVPNVLMHELSKWRELLGLPVMPRIDEETPIIRSSGNKHIAIGTRRISQLIKEAVVEVSKRMTKPADVENLTKASAHWFRHDSLTRQREELGMTPEQVAGQGGHASYDTTLIYIHTDEDKRCDAVRDLGWNRKVAEARELVFGKAE